MSHNVHGRLKTVVLIKGAGEMATGVAHSVFRSGFLVCMTEIAEPLAVRRGVSFSEAIYDGEKIVELVKAVRELKGIEPAAGRDELPLILRKVGDNVEAFLHNFPNTTSVEEIRQQTLERPGESSSHRFNYLALAAEKSPTRLQELRQDSGGHTVDAQKQLGGVVTLGFASMPLVFYPDFQAGADFRLLGRQLLERRETYVIGFAQRLDASELGGSMKLGGRPKAFLMQGVAWADSATYHILRMKAWLLPTDAARMSAADVVTDVDFAEVRFKQNPQPFWLPRDVEVTVVWNGRTYTNRHHYSDYRLFSVQSQGKQADKPPGS